MSVVTSLGDVLPAEALSGAEGGALARVARGAEAVVRPRSPEEVVDAVRWASANGVGVLPVGTGGRTTPARGDGPFMVLAMDRLSGLEIYEPADVTLTAKAGTPLADIEATLAEHRQWLPFDPPQVSSRTLGGLVATGESGPVATAYGELRNHVLGATVVCGDGRVLRLGGRVVKNVAGFDLLRPLVGSRGRLGVVTSVCLRAFPVPAKDRVLLLRSDDFAGLEAAARAVRTAPTLPASVVLWVRPTSQGAALLVRLHGAELTVDADQATLERRAGVSFARADSELVAEVRDDATDAPVVVTLSVLPSRLFEALGAARDLLGHSSVVADAYSGTARIALAEVDTDTVRALRDTIEEMGGALAVEAPDEGPEVRAAGSRPSDAETGVSTRLQEVFDPSGVFWPCRA